MGIAGNKGRKWLKPLTGSYVRKGSAVMQAKIAAPEGASVAECGAMIQ
jgi:hypothetical protein